MPILGHLPEALDLLTLLNSSYAELGDAFAWNMAGRYVAVFSSEAANKEILLTKSASLSAVDAFGPLSWMLGQGLARLDGLSHKRMKKLLLPAFHREVLLSHSSFIEERTTEALLSWQAEPFVDAVSICKDLTLSIILKSLFDVSLTQFPRLRSDLNRFFECLLFEANKPLSFVRFFKMLKLPLVKNLRYRLDSFFFELIKAELPSALSTLALLKQAKDEEGQSLSDVLIRDQLLTFVVAGHDTTATALAWSLYELARHPEVKAQLRQELMTHESSLQTVRTLPYLNAVIKEVLRLHPPISMGIRRATEDLSIDGYLLPKGTSVVFSPYLTHKSSVYWREPDAFKPERFLANNPARYQYLPFGAGEHNCIGMNLALLELQMILLQLVKTSDWRVLTDASEKLSPTLEPSQLTLEFSVLG